MTGYGIPSGSIHQGKEYLGTGGDEDGTGLPNAEEPDSERKLFDLALLDGEVPDKYQDLQQVVDRHRRSTRFEHVRMEQESIAWGDPVTFLDLYSVLVVVRFSAHR